jgi:hypothetical protein
MRHFSAGDPAGPSDRIDGTFVPAPAVPGIRTAAGAPARIGVNGAVVAP